MSFSLIFNTECILLLLHWIFNPLLYSCHKHYSPKRKSCGWLHLRSTILDHRLHYTSLIPVPDPTLLILREEIGGAETILSPPTKFMTTVRVVLSASAQCVATKTVSLFTLLLACSVLQVHWVSVMASISTHLETSNMGCSTNPQHNCSGARHIQLYCVQ